MFFNNKYINRSLAVITNNVQTTNCSSINIQTSNIQNLKRLGINKNNPNYTLDVGGNINFTGNLLQNGQPYINGSGYWDLIGDNIINANLGSVNVNTSLNVLEDTTLSTLLVTNNETIEGTLDVQGETTLSTLYVIGNETIEGKLDVQFNTTLSTLTVISNETIEGTLDVQGETTLYTLSVTNNETIGGTLDVVGNTTMSNLLTVNSINLTATSPVYNSNSVVPKSYVDTLSSGLILIGPCVCATTSSSDTTGWVYNGTNEFTGVSTILELDGYTVQNDQRVLVKDCVNKVQNGAYVYDKINGTLTRVSDLAYGESANSVVTFVQNGDTFKKTSFLQTTNPAIVGTSNLVFVQYSSFDFSINSTLKLTGNILGVNPDLSINSLNVSGNETVGGTLSVTDNTTLSTVSTTGLATLNSAIVNTTLGVTGSATVGTGLLVSAGGASITGTTNITGTTTIGTGATLITLSTLGVVTATGGFQSGSDYRIKDNIIPLDSTYTVDKLTPIKFTNKNTGNQDIGLIAHELQEFYPELVTGEFDGEQLQTVNYQGLIGILIQEIKNLKKEIKEIKEKVNM